jgi:WD40 repeat protein
VCSSSRRGGRLPFDVAPQRALPYELADLDRDRTVLLRDLVRGSRDGQGGGWTATLRGYEGAVSLAVPAPDGGHLITAGAGGTSRLWNLRGTAGRNLTADEWKTYFPDDARRATCDQFPLAP